jgi:hypothetical protein
MCTNEPLTATKEGWKKFRKISWKFATIRMGVETTPLVIRGLSVKSLELMKNRKMMLLHRPLFPNNNRKLKLFEALAQIIA